MAFLDLLRFKKKPFKDLKDVKDVKKSEKPLSKTEVVGEGKKAEKKETTAAAKELSPLSDLIVCPYLSEKSSLLAEQNTYVFEVKIKASKGQISEALRAIYGVKPIAVKTISIKGKGMHYGRVGGQTKNWKKALATFPKDAKIEVYK